MKILKIPDYCDNFEFKLVEELSLSDPLDLHYGKCTVIGRLACDAKSHYLENIQLKFMSKEYQLPTGSVRVFLLPDSKLDNFVSGAYAEVHGEAAFWRTDLCWNERGKDLPKTTRDLIVDMRRHHIKFNDLDSQAILDAKEIPPDGCLTDDDVKSRMEQFKSIWKPAIHVYTINIVNEAEELIHCNLKMRLLRKKYKLMTEVN